MTSFTARYPDVVRQTRELLKCSDEAGWRQCFDKFDDALALEQRERAKRSEKRKTFTLVAVRKRFVDICNAYKSKGFLTRDEVQGIVDYKMTVGSMRPNHLMVTQKNTEDLVVQSTRSAFNKIQSDYDGALTAFQEIKGAGIATATFALSELAPNDLPAMEDCALTAFNADKP